MFQSPYPPYDPTDKLGFSYETVVRRWPVIITGIIDRLCRINHDFTLELQANPESEGSSQLRDKVAESKAIIEQISKLKYHMGRDHALEPIPDDGEPLVEQYNEELDLLTEQGKNTWFTAPWLYAECYLYRFLRSLFSQTQHWRTFDPFFSQKMDMFKHSRNAIFQLAKTMKELEVEREQLKADPTKLAVLFKEMIQMCLWGNATDLSLLTHLTPADIQHLQAVGKDAQEARKDFILKDDQDAAWKHIETLHDARLDFVLDNAGFELFTDLVFADFLVTHTPYVSSVVFHPKLIPWFVSDVTPPDFSTTLSWLLDPSFFTPPSSADEAGSNSTEDPPDSQSLYENLTHMVSRWQTYVDNGTFKLSVPLQTALGGSVPPSADGVSSLSIGDANLAEFWTSPYAYWDMQVRAPTLWKFLSQSGLVIFKGDLNYRKLTGDVKWPASTPFKEALGPLAGSFPLLSLRTNKAEVVIGVDQDVADRLDKSGERWRIDGRYALISFLPKS